MTRLPRHLPAPRNDRNGVRPSSGGRLWARSSHTTPSLMTSLRTSSLIRRSSPTNSGSERSRTTSITCLIEPGRVCHDDNAVGEEDCFRNAVGDKDDRLALVLPDAQQFLLQNFARLRVNRAKRARPSVIYRGTVALGGQMVLRFRNDLPSGERQWRSSTRTSCGNCAMSGRSRSGPRSTSAPRWSFWVVVADDEVFVRSVRGGKGRWHRDLATGGSATLEFAGRQLEVQAIPADDAASIARASREFLRK